MIKDNQEEKIPASEKMLGIALGLAIIILIMVTKQL